MISFAFTDSENISNTVIEEMLNKGKQTSEIAKALGKSPSTISREIRNRRQESNKSAVGRIPNRCIHRYDCEKKNCCDKYACGSNNLCRLCRYCNETCSSYKEDVCVKLSRTPYVCNGCEKSTSVCCESNSIRTKRRRRITSKFYQSLDPGSIFPRKNYGTLMIISALC